MENNFALYKKITRESYQATAAEFAQNVVNLAPTNSIQKFMSLLTVKPRIVDIGCGSGRDAKIFADMGAEVLGIDFCPSLLNIAKNYASEASFKLMDIEAMDLPPSSFDGVWAVCSLGHIPKSLFPSVLKNIHTILNKNGYLHLALKKGLGEGMEADTRYAGNPEKFWSFFEENELKAFIKEAGFEITDFKLAPKEDSYQTGAAFSVFCQKKS